MSVQAWWTSPPTAASIHPEDAKALLGTVGIICLGGLIWGEGACQPATCAALPTMGCSPGTHYYLRCNLIVRLVRRASSIRLVAPRMWLSSCTEVVAAVVLFRLKG